VIPKFVIQFIKHKPPTINGDGSYSRDFTYIDNVIEANIRSLTAIDPASVNSVFNVAYGERTTLNELSSILREYLADYDPAILDIPVHYGPKREGDVPHSLASIEKARKLLGYDPEYNISRGLKEAVAWYWEHLK